MEALFKKQVIKGKLKTYPTNLTKKDLKKLSKNPFSVVTKKDKNISEIPYNIYYKNNIKQIINTLNQLEASFKNKKVWSDYIKTIKRGFLKDAWEDVEKEFLKMNLNKNEQFVLNIGPIESVHDSLLGTKKFYTLVFGEVDKQKTEQVNKIVKNLGIKNTKVLIENILFWSGELKALRASGWSRPENPKLIKNIGTVKQLFLFNIENKANNLYIPLLKIVNNGKNAKIKNYLKEKYYLNVLFHELGHTIKKPKDAQTRLGKYYNGVEEARAEIQSYNIALDQGDKINLDIESFIITSLITFAHMHWIYKNKNIRKPYSQGAKILWSFAEKHKHIYIKNKQLEFKDTKKLALKMQHYVQNIAESKEEKDIKKIIKEPKTLTFITNWINKNQNA